MKGPRALQPFKTFQKAFVPPIWRVVELSNLSKPLRRSKSLQPFKTPSKGICSTYIKGRNQSKSGVPKTGSPKKSVCSEIDDFGVCVGFTTFGGQKSSKSRGPQNRLSQKERLLWNWRFWCFCVVPPLFGGQKSSQSRGPQNRLSEKERFLWNWRFWCFCGVPHLVARTLKIYRSVLYFPDPKEGGLQGTLQRGLQDQIISFWRVSPMPSASGLQVLESAAQGWPWGYPGDAEPPFKTAKKGNGECSTYMKAGEASLEVFEPPA